MDKLEPIHKLVLRVVAWVALAALAFFFHAVGFVIAIAWLAYYVNMLLFVFEHTKDVPYDSSDDTDGTIPYSESSVDEWDYPEMGSNWQGSLQENLPEDQG